MSQSDVPLAGVIGDPVGHSRSPRLHGFWLSQYRVRGHYVPLHVVAADLEASLRLLPRLGFVGLNVTVPHKETVLAFADQISPVAARIGAANTLTFDADGRIHADNTDALGFADNLRQSVPDWRPSAAPAAVFGAGGAARAVVAGLLDLGVPDIRLTNRTRARAEALADAFGPAVTVIDWEDCHEALAGAGLVVNTTSLGMEGQQPFPPVLHLLTPGTVAADIVYAPLETPFLIAARAAGARCVDGLGMLLYQAVPGFERWFGVRPSVTDELRQAVMA